MLTNEYDVNLYVLDKELHVHCYPMGVDTEGEFVHTDTTVDPITLSIPLYARDESLKDILKYLLNNKTYWNVPFEDASLDSWEEYWEEHDEWTGSRYLLEGPSMLSNWIKALPFYNAPVTQQRGM